MSRKITQKLATTILKLSHSFCPVPSSMTGSVTSFLKTMVTYLSTNDWTLIPKINCVLSKTLWYSLV